MSPRKMYTWYHADHEYKLLWKYPIRATSAIQKKPWGTAIIKLTIACIRITMQVGQGSKSSLLYISLILIVTLWFYSLPLSVIWRSVIVVYISSRLVMLGRLVVTLELLRVTLGLLCRPCS